MALPADLSDLAGRREAWRIILRFSGDELALAEASSSLVSEKPGHSFGYILFSIQVHNFVFLGTCSLLLRYHDGAPLLPSISSHVKDVPRPLSHTVAFMCLVAPQECRVPP